MNNIYKVMIACGVSWTIYNFCFFKTTILVSDNPFIKGEVHNIGLVTQQMNNINLGIGVTIIGTVLLTNKKCT